MSEPPMPTHHGVEAPVEGTYPNETLRLLHQRGSCRHFKDQKIPKEVLELILGAAIHAPSGGNIQAFSIIKIEDSERREKIKKICGNQRFIGEAPVNLVICLDMRRVMRWAELDVAPYTFDNWLLWFLFCFQLTGIIGQSICIAADSLGLGSCYVGNATLMAGKVAELLELPRGVFPGTLISMGYPVKRPPTMKKHRLSTLLHDEKYRDLPDDELLARFREKWTAPGAQRVEITEKRLERLYQTCLRVHGKEFAERSVADSRKLGYISPVQRYFGLHYRADWVYIMPNSDYLKIIEKQGWNICKDYEPPKQ
ncbi:MAG: nitroreductase family protein [Candidatus Bathyarchaeota archaeon]|nr:nitroreductase family protein [Candidatus Bathyarchaeota archaeon]